MRLPFRRKPGRPSDGISYQVVEVIGTSAKSLDEAVDAAAERIAESARTRRGWPSVDIVGLAMLGAAAAGAFASARALLERDPEQLPVPEPLQGGRGGAAGRAAPRPRGHAGRHRRGAPRDRAGDAGAAGRVPRTHGSRRRRRPPRAGRHAPAGGADPRPHHGGRRLGSPPYLGPRGEPYTGSGEVSEWFKVPLSKSGRRKPRGFESHPLRQHPRRSRAHRRDPGCFGQREARRRIGPPEGALDRLTATFANLCGEVLEWLNRLAWKAGRGKPLVGSNPTLSAITAPSAPPPQSGSAAPSGPPVAAPTPARAGPRAPPAEGAPALGGAVRCAGPGAQTRCARTTTRSWYERSLRSKSPPQVISVSASAETSEARIDAQLPSSPAETCSRHCTA